MLFKAIFFDLDGTLVDLHGPLFNAAKKALDDLGQTPPLTRQRYWEAVANNDMTHGLPEHSRRDFIKLSLAYFTAEADATERMEVLPHVPETLAELKRRGYATAVITSRPGDPKLLLGKLSMVGLATHLDQVMTQNDAPLGRMLDKTEKLREAASHIDAPPAQCVYVGDEPRDIMAATAAHYGAAIAVATGPASYARLLSHPRHRAGVVMKSMGELLDVIDRMEAGIGQR